MASRASPLLEVTFHRSLLRTLIEHSVVCSAENPSRATQIGRSDAHQYHTGRESAAGLPGHRRLKPSRSLPATSSATPKHPAFSARKKVQKRLLTSTDITAVSGVLAPLKRSARGAKVQASGKT